MSTLEVHIMNCVAKLFVGTGKKRSQNKRMFFCWENIHAFLVRRYVEGRYTREKMGMNRLLLPDAYIYCCCVFSLFRVCVHSLSCTSVYAFLRFFVRHHRIQNGIFFFVSQTYRKSISLFVSMMNYIYGQTNGYECFAWFTGTRTTVLHVIVQRHRSTLAERRVTTTRTREEKKSTAAHSRTLARWIYISKRKNATPLSHS